MAAPVSADCPVGNLNDDCQVNWEDLRIFADQWLNPDCAGHPDDCADLDDANGVNWADFVLLANNWRKKGSELVISEFMASNNETLADQDGDYPDWIEIYNMSATPVDLDGWYLTDNLNDLDKWKFPAGVRLGPDEFLVVFASDKNLRDTDNHLHTNFKLSSSGEYLALVNPDGTVTHQYYPQYPQQLADVSYGMYMGIATTITTTLVDESAEKKVFIPTGDIGDAWKNQIGFDDSSWTAGTPIIPDKTGGVGFDKEDTYEPFISYDVKTDMQNENTTCYIRIPFSVNSDPNDLTSLTLAVQYDDGFVAYLNGTEVARAQAPETLEYDSSATGNRPDEEAIVFEEFNLSNFISLLQLGDNLLAIHGLNVNLGSSDFLISADLTAETALFELEPDTPDISVFFTIPTPGTTNWAGSSELGPIIQEIRHTPLVPADNEDIVVTAKITDALADVNTSSVKLHYRVMYDPDQILTMVDDGSAADAAAGDNIYSAVIPHSAFSAGQMVRWYFTAKDIEDVNSRWPLFFYETASDEYLGTVVSDPTVTSELPILQLFAENTEDMNERSGTRCSVFYDEQFYDNCFIRLRGDSTTVMKKKNHKIEFNRGNYFRFSPDEIRVNEINLNAVYADSSYLRDHLSMTVLSMAGAPSCYTFPLRVQLNSSFNGLVIFIEQVDSRFMKRYGFDPEGSLYKAHYSPLDDAYSFYLKNDSDYLDLEELVDGLALPESEKMKYIFDYVNIPEVISYLAAGVVDSMTDFSDTNYYLFFDSFTGQWHIFGWDRDLSWGYTWMGTTIETDRGIYAGSGNLLFGSIFNDTRTEQMFLRRVRTVVDDLLGSTPGTLEDLIDELHDKMKPDADLDRAVWGFTTHEWFVGHPQVDFDTAVEQLKYDYLSFRRSYVYSQSELPSAQPSNPSPTIDFNDIEFNPASGNQDEEYIELINTNSFAVDISGWKLTEAVEFTFQPGTVIASDDSLYVTPNTKAFRSRTSGPSGGQGLFVQGNYRGHLSSWGETINLLDADNNLIQSMAYEGAPSDQQRYLRITEIMYHPDDPCEGSSYDDEDFEFIELTNIGTESINLTLVSFTDGIDFTFGLLELAPDEYIIVAKDTNAFAERYPDVCGVQILGPYEGQLSNSGENIKLEDDSNSTILEFDYEDDWYPITDGFGFSLTIIDPCNPNLDSWDEKKSWRPSALLGGSPGCDDGGPVQYPGNVVINELLAHSHAEDPDWIELHNTTDQPINIGGWFLSDDEDDFMKYEVAVGTSIPPNDGYIVFYEDPNFGNPSDPGCHTPFALSENGEKVYLSSGQDGQLTGYQEVQKFDASETNVSFGRYTKSTGDVDFVAMDHNTPGLPNAYPKIGPIVITEIMYHPKGDVNTDAEYVELYNITDSTINLFDAEDNPWKFEDDDDPGIDYLFGADANIPAYSFALLVKNNVAFNTAGYPSVPPGVQIFEWGNGKLSNGNQEIIIGMPGDLDNGQRQYIRIDSIEYDDQAPWPTEPDGTGPSLTRLFTNAYANDPNNWQAASPTPRQ